MTVLFSGDQGTHWLLCECCHDCDRKKIKCYPVDKKAGNMMRVVVFGEHCKKHKDLVIYEQHVPRSRVVEI